MALTLREVCGLTTEEIARAFLTAPATVAQRMVRAKAKIKAAHIPYHIPSRIDLPDRMDAVLHVVYLVFNEGYSASFGESLTRSDLSNEAIRLGRLLMELLAEPEIMGLLALMLLQESRRHAQTSPVGDLILLEDQDRSLWNREQISEGLNLVERARVTTVRAVHPSSGDRGGPCPGFQHDNDRLGADCQPLRRAVANRAVARRRIEPCGCCGHARRSSGGPGID